MAILGYGAPRVTQKPFQTKKTTTTTQVSAVTRASEFELLHAWMARKRKEEIDVTSRVVVFIVLAGLFFRCEGGGGGRGGGCLCVVQGEVCVGGRGFWRGWRGRGVCIVGGEGGRRWWMREK